MKCLILAGGRGDRMWPLSRKNNPKQFITIRNKHSIFQETVARNMAFCDEFIIAASSDYESIIENQMKAFEGLTYRCVYEETGRSTTAPITLTALSLPQSELLFTVSSDHLISGENYKDDILAAKDKAQRGGLVAFGMPMHEADTRFGYIKPCGDRIECFTEKPDATEAKEYLESGRFYTNGGMFLFRVGDYLNELRIVDPYMYSQCNSAYYMKEVVGNKTYYRKNVMDMIPAKSIEQSLYVNTRKGRMVEAGFDWKDIGSLDDLTGVKFDLDKEEQLISNKCKNTTVINRCSDKLVLTNHLEDIMVVNTEDAVYIGKKGKSNDLKSIIHDSVSMWGYFDKSREFYHIWGESKILYEDRNEGYQVRKITVLPGKTIKAHSHSGRTESISIAKGSAQIGIGDSIAIYNAGDTLTIEPGCVHQISCISETNLVYTETATGLNALSDDFVTEVSPAPSETELGFDLEPFVKLSPVYKDYLWGGDRLKDGFGKTTDLEIIAESWELSAHPDGQSVIASGRYKGLTFGEYLNKIGADALGWKCLSDRAFPLMIKLIDAKDDLSVQVHPDDDYALINEHEYGKSELWHIVEALPGACIYMGLKKNCTADEIRSSLKDGSVLELLNKVEVHPGEDYFIPAGTIHAIGAGIIICEVQQSSNSTYRLYDYNRVDKYGNKRRLDIDKAMDVIDLKAYNGAQKCKYFDVKTLKIGKSATIDTNEESFYALMVLDGNGTVSAGKDSMELAKGDCVFIPKRSDKVKVKGKLEILTARI